MPSIYDLQDAYDGSLTMGWHRHSHMGYTKRRPYMIAAAPGNRYKNRHRFKRGGRFKKRRARRACLTGGRPEKKFLDAARDLAPTTTGLVTLLSDIPQGDGESQRIGRKATITNIMLKGHINIVSEASNNPRNRVRVVVVWDHSTNGVAFTGSDVFNIAGTADINAYRDLSLVGRFTVLYDKVSTITVPYAGDGTTQRVGDHFRDLRINLKCCIPIEYDASASTGAITTQQVNSVHLLLFEEAATPGTSIHLITRVRYVG